MKKYLIAALLIISFLQTALVYAASPTNTLIMLLATVQTMKADFTQQITDKNMKVIQKSSGTMAMQKPGKFRWQERSPTKQLIIANGDRLSIYDPDLEQVTIRQLSAEIGQTPALLLSDTNHSLEKNFDVQLASETNDPIQWFVLSPKNKDSMFTAIRLGFGLFNIQGMVLQDHLGHTTTIKFTNVVADQPLKGGLFNFTPPANVDIIDETKKQ